MRTLLNKQILNALLSPSKRNRDWLIEKTELDTLILNLKTNARLQKAVAGNCNIKRYSFAGVNFVSLLQKMLAGEVKYCFIETTESPLSLNQFLPYFNTDEENQSDLLTPKEACIALKVNKNVIYDFIARGLIEHTRGNITRTSRSVVLIPQSSIRTFREKYLLRHQIKNTPLKNRHVISGPKVDGGLINVYQKIPL